MAKLTTIEALEQLGYKKEDLRRQSREAARRGKEELNFAPRAVGTSSENGLVAVRLSTGWSFMFDPRIFKPFQKLTDDQIAEVKPLGQGFALVWPSLDLHLGVGGLIYDLIGPKFIEAESARRRGAATSVKKKAASRKNGKLGGRPKKSNGKLLKAT
jgi:hypothetical protein